MTLEEQITDFASLGEVGPMPGSDEAMAEELTRVLMQPALAGGPLARIANLTGLVNVFKLAAKHVTTARNREADSLTAVWPYRRIASLLGVNGSTMQGWVADGAKVRIEAARRDAVNVALQEVSRETASANGAMNSNLNSVLAIIQ